MLPTTNYALGSLIAAADSGPHFSTFAPFTLYSTSDLKYLILPSFALAARLWLDTEH